MVDIKKLKTTYKNSVATGCQDTRRLIVESGGKENLMHGVPDFTRA